MLSGKERDRLKVLHELQGGHLTQGEAAGQLGISDREVRRLLSRIAAEGDRGVVHRLRGRASNRRLPESLRSRALKLVKGNMTPSTPESSTRLAVQISLTGTRAKGRAFSPRVARTMLRKLSSVMGLCSISIHRKSKPRLAACAAISALPTVRVIPTAGLPSRSSFFTGFSHPSCGLMFLVGIKTLLCPVYTYREFLVYRILLLPATLNP